MSPWFWGFVAVAQPVDTLPTEVPEPAVIAQPLRFDPDIDRYIGRERRARGIYGGGVLLGLIGGAIELVGVGVQNDPLQNVGGAMEATAAPIMAVSSLRSASALGKFAEVKAPVFGYIAVTSTSLDLVLTLSAQNENLTLQQRRLAGYTAIGLRVVTFTTAVIQQERNNRVRRRLGLRVGGLDRPRRPRVAIAPWLADRGGGILLSLSDGRGGQLPRSEQYGWTSQP